MDNLGKLYRKYQAELYNRKVISNDNGFILYNVYNDDSLYIHGIYVDSDARGKNAAEKLEAELIELHNPKVITCYVDLTTNNPELSLKVILARGYTVYAADQYGIKLMREL